MSSDPHSPGASSSGDPPRISATVRALGFVSLFNDTAGDMIHPLLPAFIAAVGGGPEILGLIEGVAETAASLLQVVSGYLADRLGDLKRLTFAGYTVAIVLRPMLALATTWWQILIVRFGDRVGKGVRSAPRDSILAEASHSTVRGRAYGFHRAMDNAGAVFGPAAAYLMLARGFSIRTVFALSAVPGAIALILLFVVLRSAPERGVARSIHLSLPPSHTFRRYLLAIFIFTLGCSSDSFLLWRAREVGVALEYAPILWMVLAMVKAGTSTWGGALSDYAGRRILILAAWAIYAVVYLGFGFAWAPWQIWVLFAIYGTFYGLSEGPERAMVVDLVRDEWRGRALGAYHAAVGFASLPASLMFGVIYQTAGASAAFAMGAGFAVVAAIALPRQRT